MTTITIDGADRALDAGAWLAKHCIDYELFGIGILSPNPQYQFRFRNPQDASHFVLKWQ